MKTTSIARWAIFLIPLKLITLMIGNLKINAIKRRQCPYYTNVYYKYTHQSFNVDNMKFITII
jgi:hypothetical protein